MICLRENKVAGQQSVDHSLYLEVELTRNVSLINDLKTISVITPKEYNILFNNGKSNENLIVKKFR